MARFVDPHTIETESGLRLHAEKVIVCTGGVPRRLSVPGVEYTATHSDAWSLTAVPPSLLVIGAEQLVRRSLRSSTHSGRGSSSSRRARVFCRPRTKMSRPRSRRPFGQLG